MKCRFLRWVRAGAGCLVLGSAALFAFKWGADSRFFSAYDGGVPVKAEGLNESTDTGALIRYAVLDGVRGADGNDAAAAENRIPILAHFPEDPSGNGSPLPCLIFLHGIGQSKNFLGEIAPAFTSRGYAIASFDQYTRGERRPDGGRGGIAAQALDLRKRAALTVMETRRLVDYLSNDPRIAPDEIYLVGASFGAMMGAIAAAQEERLAGAALIYGGGNWSLFGESAGARTELTPWQRRLAVGVGTFLLAPADPVDWVGQVAPRPVLLLNGSRDSIIPKAAASALMQAAGPHAETIWYDSDHVGLDRDHVEVILEDVIDWLERTRQGRAKKRVISQFSGDDS
ncbi:MAG: dienelactone hydrolase family protein [Verrucomicrobiales bacterium]